VSTTHAVTADELFTMPRDGMRRELVRGEVRTTPPADARHGFVIMRVAGPLAEFVRANGLGIVLGAGTGFQIGTNPDTVRAPDVAYLCRERIPARGIPLAFWSGAPDLAVEVISPSDTVEDVDEKVDEWLAAGTREVWVVKPRQRTVLIYRAPNAVTVLLESDAIEGGEILPGFRSSVADVFPH
jgi:Uma2 family endonuclease